MWQRIQTFYMVVVAILFAVMLTTPIVDFTGVSGEYVLNFFGIQSVSTKPELILNTMFLSIIEIIIAIISLVAVFFFKKRIIQIRLNVFNAILMIGYYILLSMYIYIAGKDGNLDFHLRMPVAFPLVSAILTYLAIRAIGKDEALVRSFDRIR